MKGEEKRKRDRGEGGKEMKRSAVAYRGLQGSGALRFSASEIRERERWIERKGGGSKKMGGEVMGGNAEGLSSGGKPPAKALGPRGPSSSLVATAGISASLLLAPSPPLSLFFFGFSSFLC